MGFRDWFRRYPRVHSTDTVIQMEAAECGAVCLQIVLSYFGRYVPLEDLRMDCGVSRDGCNAFNLLEAAKLQGMEAEGYELTVEELKEVLRPAVLYWEYNHFVVLESLYPGECAWINDPAVGPRKISWSELAVKYSGIAFLLQPGEGFKKGGAKERYVSQIWERIRPYKRSIFFLLLCQLGISLLGLLPPIFTRIFVDQILQKEMWSWARSFLTAFSIFFLLLVGFHLLQAGALRRLKTKLTILSSARFLLQALRLPIFFFYQRLAPEVISRIQLNTIISQELVGKAGVAILSLFFIFFYAFIMVQYDLVITALGIASAAFNLILLWLISESRKISYAHLQQEQAKLTGRSIDFLLNMESVKAAGAQPHLFSKVIGLQTDLLNAWQGIGKKDVWLFSLTKFAQNITTIALLLVGSWRVMFGSLSIGMLIAFQFLMQRFLNPFEEVVSMGSLLQTLKVDMNRVNDVMHHPKDLRFSVKNEESDQKIPPLLTFKNVTFGYAPLDEPLFKELSFSVSATHRVALVGPTGAGKSTIAHLAANLFAPWSGEILYGEHPPTAYAQKEIAASLATVSQDIFLFRGTIYENLTLWDGSVPEEEVKRALKAACVLDDVLALEEGIHAPLLEKGHNLSEGQRQRLEIARAFLHRPSILILDEATSALDDETEKRVYANLAEMRCACLIITHRLNVVRQCQEILVLDRGKVVEKGSHSELMKLDGLYAEMINQQAFG